MKTIIRKRRLALRMSSTELARRARVSRPHLSNIENGRRRATLRLALAVGHVLGISPAAIIAGGAS